MGQFNADIDTAGARPCGRGPTARLSSPAGQRKAPLRRGDLATRIRARKHESFALRHRCECVPGRGALEEPILRGASMRFTMMVIQGGCESGVPDAAPGAVGFSRVDRSIWRAR